MEKLSESTKTQNIPKVKLALEDSLKAAAQKAAAEDATRNKAPSDAKLPKPTGWRILILPFQPKKVTKGGVHIADTAAERQHLATVCGLVLEMGPDCYSDKKRYPDGPWCKKGEWVIFARYAGSRFKIEGGEVRILNEDEILATIQDPEQILHDM
jgi:chaperonin GroES